MARKGAPRNSSGRFQSSSAARKQEDNLLVLPIGPSNPPPAPTGLTANAKAAWESFWRSKVAKLVIDVDLMPLRRLFTMYSDRERYLRVAHAKPVVVGYKGQPRPHPLFAQAASMERDIRALEDRFLITPQARDRMRDLLRGREDGPTLDEMNDALDADEPGDAEDPRLHAGWDDAKPKTTPEEDPAQ